MLYCTSTRLHKAYTRSGAFNVTSEGVFAVCSEEEHRRLRNQNTPKAEKIKILYGIYSKATDSTKRLDKGVMNEFQKDYPKEFEAFELIGFSKMKKLDFQDSAIKTEIKKAKFEKQAKSEKVTTAVYKVFEENTFYATRYIKEQLKEIFDNNGVEIHRQPQGQDILLYFRANERRTREERGWELLNRLSDCV